MRNLNIDHLARNTYLLCRGKQVVDSAVPYRKEISSRSVRRALGVVGKKTIDGIDTFPLVDEFKIAGPAHDFLAKILTIKEIANDIFQVALKKVTGLDHDFRGPRDDEIH